MLVKVNINGKDYEARDDEKILSLCLKVGIFVPHLCFLNDHTPSGRCGLCVVEVDNGTIALACLTTVKDGMVIKTDSFVVRKIRKSNMERILKTHNTNCLACYKSGCCKLQKYITKTFERSIDHDSNFFDSDVKDVFVKLTDDILFNKSKCINCNRCVKFLCETCDMECKSVEVANYGNSHKDDFTGNVIDICPTAALKANNGFSKVPYNNMTNVVTYDVSNVFTPKIQGNVWNNKIVDIVSLNGNWIPNNIRFVANNLKHYETDLSYVAENIINNLPAETMDKKVFIIGEQVDIETLFIIQYISEVYPNCMIVVDDSGIEKEFIQNIGISIQKIARIQHAIFINIPQTSCRFYVKHCIKNLEKCSYVDGMQDLPLINSEQRTHIFISANAFVNNVSKLLDSKIPFSIIPQNCTQIMMKYITNYVPLSKFLEEYNQHDIRFACIVGQHSDISIKNVDIMQVVGKHFLEDQAYFVNVFEKIVKTKPMISSEVVSTREFFISVLRAMYKEQSRDVLHRIQEKIKTIFKL